MLFDERTIMKTYNFDEDNFVFGASGNEEYFVGVRTR